MLLRNYNTIFNTINIMLDVNKIRQDFPILARTVHNKPLVYFDNAASSQKPLAVIDAISNYYQNSHANIHRAVHYLGDLATEQYEQVRTVVRDFIHAKSEHEVIFTKGTTESINLIATSFERSDYVKPADEIILSVAEHHSNIVPWQLLAAKKGLVIKVVHILPNGDLNLEQLVNLLSERTKIVALTHVSNSLGTINPVKDIIQKVKNYNKNIFVVIDGAQAVPNIEIDVQDLNCDFYAFSSHKVYGPTGVGVLYGKEYILNILPPYQGGGEMIAEVKLPMGTTYAHLPQKYEAGTPNIAGVIGLGAAISYLKSLDFTKIKEHKNNLTAYCASKLHDIDSLMIYGLSKNKVSVISFVIDNVNAQDVGLLLDQHGIAVRTGHHCNMPLMNYLGIPGTIRASFGIYNTTEEVDIFVQSLKKVIAVLH
jgi:cysteine desulfurase/selenocysteine lyase